MKLTPEQVNFLLEVITNPNLTFTLNRCAVALSTVEVLVAMRRDFDLPDSKE
jgi:hypothetical protein